MTATTESYRYELHRELSSSSTTITMVMLNPSTADATTDDPTIRRCIAFARRELAGSLQVVNLFAFRATDPRDLGRAHKEGRDVVGYWNDTVLHEVFCTSNNTIVAAWGAHRLAKTREHRLTEILKAAGSPPLLCLGRTKCGAPRHPLYLRSDSKLEPWSRG
jgi:hypothetical protein